MRKITHAEIIHDAAQQLFDKYVEHCMASISGGLARDAYGHYVQADIMFLEQIEHQVPIHTLENISDVAVGDFRRSIVAFVGSLTLKGITPNWSSNLSLKTAILSHLAKHYPEIMEMPVEQPKYRRINDEWEPAW